VCDFECLLYIFLNQQATKLPSSEHPAQDILLAFEIACVYIERRFALTAGDVIRIEEVQFVVTLDFRMKSGLSGKTHHDVIVGYSDIVLSGRIFSDQYRDGQADPAY
jgi:hypothetical protein